MTVDRREMRGLSSCSRYGMVHAARRFRKNKNVSFHKEVLV
jgi:hypothetical protein